MISAWRVRTLLAEVESTPDPIETFHTDPRVLAAIGIFLQARDPDGLIAEQMTERFERLVPGLNAFALFLQHTERLSDAELSRHMSVLFPGTWHNAHPQFEIRRVGSARYLVLIASNVPNRWNGTLDLFDGRSYVTLVWEDAARTGIEDVAVSGKHVEVTYQRIGGDLGPFRLDSVRAEQHSRTWRVSREPLPQPVR